MKDRAQLMFVLTILLVWATSVSVVAAQEDKQGVLLHFIPAGSPGSALTPQRDVSGQLDVLPQIRARTNLTYGAPNSITGSPSVVFANHNTGNNDGSFLYVPDHRALDLAYQDGFTIEVIVCPGELKNCVVLRRTEPGSSVGYALTVLANGAFQLDLDSGWERLTLSGPVGMIQLGQWYHVAVTWDGKNATMYIDGRKVSSGIFADWLDPVAADLGIGAIVRDLRRSSSGQFFHGEISEIRIIGRALSPAHFLRVR